MQAEERLKQLTAGEAREDAPQTRHSGPGDEITADVADDAPRAVVAAVVALSDDGMMRPEAIDVLLVLLLLVAVVLIWIGR